MKKTIIHAIIAASAALGFASCDKQESAQLENMADYVPVTIEALQGETTRSSITNLDFSWIASDQLSVIYGKEKGAKFTVKELSAGNSASFSGALQQQDEAQTLYAIYPYDEAYSISGTGTEANVSITMPAEQNQNFKADGSIDPRSIGAYSFMTGKSEGTVDIAQAKELGVEMSNLIAIIDFEIKNITPGMEIKKLTLRSDENSFASTAKIEFTADGSTPTVTAGAADSKALTLTMNKGEGFTPETDGYIAQEGFVKLRTAMLPQTIKAGTKWFIDLETSNGTVTFEKTFAEAKEYVSRGQYTASFDFATVIPESIFDRKHYATASYANQLEIDVNTSKQWSVEELTDERGGFSIVSPTGIANPGDKLILTVTKHTDTDKVYNASYKITPKGGMAETIYVKQANAIATAAFTGTDWDIDQGTPTFSNGAWTMHTDGSKLDIETNKSMSIVLDNMSAADRLGFYYYSQKGSYRSVYFDINKSTNKTDIFYYHYDEPVATDEEKATFERQVELNRSQENKYDIQCFPTPDGNIIALYINEVFVTEVDPTFTNKYLGGEPWRYMLRGFGGGASKITQWGESKLGINDAQWAW